MNLLIDSDAFCKLGIGGVLLDAMSLLGATPGSCRRLQALPHMLRRGKLFQNYGAESCSRLLTITATIPPLPSPDAHWLDQLVADPTIDFGEAH
jgi:hypothetical protein